MLPPPPIETPPEVNVAPPLISEFAQSLIFWVVFLSVMGYLIYQYMRRNPVLAGGVVNSGSGGAGGRTGTR